MHAFASNSSKTMIRQKKGLLQHSNPLAASESVAMMTTGRTMLQTCSTGADSERTNKPPLKLLWCLAPADEKRGRGAMQGRASERTGRSRLNSHEAHERTVAPCRLHCWSLQFSLLQRNDLNYQMWPHSNTD